MVEQGQDLAVLFIQASAAARWGMINPPQTIMISMEVHARYTIIFHLAPYDRELGFLFGATLYGLIRQKQYEHS